MASNESKTKTARLLYASSERCADVLYFVNMFVPDAFIVMQVGSKKIGVFTMLEHARAVREAALHEVLAIEPLIEQAKKRFQVKTVGVLEVIRVLAHTYNIDTFEVPYDFPVGLAFGLQRARLKVVAVPGAFFPRREVKNDQEARYIQQGNAACAVGFRAAEAVLKAAMINHQQGNKLYYAGKVLTSERLRMIIDKACLEVGAIASHTICAGGDQACDPHCAGHGPLYGNELIIIDIFPRIAKTGYHGDMTRTYLKGTASPEQKRLVATVAKAQKAALQQLQARVAGRKVHGAVLDTFAAAGYVTEKVAGVWQGFFHGTGHGLGLEVHEAPRVNTGANRLKKGCVVTIEPGLYYPGLGACRIEDVAWVKEGGYTLLSKHSYRWLIPA